MRNKREGNLQLKADICKLKKYLDQRDRVFRQGKKDIMVCDFDKVFPSLTKKSLNVFYITRPAFYKKSNLICDTINFFMKYYDEDNELITAYVHIKAMSDLTIMAYTFKSFVDDIVNRLFTESMVGKVKKMVEDQYRIDLEASNKDEKYAENPYQYTNKHGKILMEISTAVKIIIPIISHYYAVRNDMLDENLVLKTYIYHCFYALFPLFEGDTNIYNKLYATVDKIVTNTEYQDSGMWKRNKNKGNTPTTEKNRITKIVIQDLLYKYEFNQNPINLNYVAIKGTLKNIIGGKDTYDYSDINTKRTDSKMSGLEQLEMNAARIDERDIIISTHGSKNRIKKLIKQYDVKIKEKDLKFYEENLEMNQTQINVILMFFADDFKGLENLKFVKARDLYKLIIIMKKELSRRGFKVMPSLITGKPSNKIKGRKIGPKKLAKIKSFPRYYNLMQQYKDVKVSIDESMIIRYIGTFINVPMTYVDHNKKDRLGDDIDINENVIIDESIRLIEMF